MDTPSRMLNFATTRWTLVLRARGDGLEAQSALGELCQSYWQPVYRFLIREGRCQDEASDLAQEFFAHVLGGGAFAGVEQNRGRFRSYLLGALKHFLANQRKLRQRQKRGGGVEPESLDAIREDGSAMDLPDVSTLVSDAYFDRQWAFAVMDGALNGLQKECIVAGKSGEFEMLKPWLGGEAQTMTQLEVAAKLGLTEAAVKVAVHRLRKRFRELIRKELADTVPAPADVEDELRYLLEVLAHP